MSIPNWQKLLVITALLCASPAAMADSVRANPVAAQLTPQPIGDQKPARPSPAGLPTSSDMITPDLSIGAPQHTPGESPLAAFPSTERAWHDVTVVKVLPKDAKRTDAQDTDANIHAAMRTVDAYYRDVSEGRVRFRITQITGWHSLKGANCHNYYGMMSQTLRSVTWQRGRNKHLLLWVPTRAICPHSGQAEVAAHMHAGGTAYVAGTTFRPETVAHELGHNLGFAHSGGAFCKPGAVDDTFDGNQYQGKNNCQMREYGDWYDIMGMAATTKTDWGTLAPRHRSLIGLDQAGKAIVRGPKYLRIPVAHEVSGGAARYPTVILPGGDQYSLEYRTAAGRNSYLSKLAVQRGLLIRRTLVKPAKPTNHVFTARSLLLQASRQFNLKEARIRTAFLTDKMSELPLGTGNATVKVVAMDDRSAIVMVTMGGVQPPPESDPRKIMRAKSAISTPVRKAQPAQARPGRKKATRLMVGATTSDPHGGTAKRALIPR